MWQGLNWNKIIFLAIFLAVVSMLATVNFIFELSAAGYRPVWSSGRNLVKRQLEEKYPNELNAVFQKHLLANQQLSATDLASLNDELLALKVPTRYQRLHWELVKNLDILKAEASLGERQASQAALRSLVDQYQWLSKTLSQLLLAIY